MDYYRPTWAHIDLKALTHNYKLVKKIVGKDVKTMVTVKADAYGHGILAVSKTLCRLGVDFLGVASIDEGITLRRSGIKQPILVLGVILPGQTKPVLHYDLIQTVCDMKIARELDKRALLSNKKAKVHIKVDTGMGRIGVSYYEALKLIKNISKLKNIEISGVFTHFPMADMDPIFSKNQIKLFSTLLDKIRESKINIKYSHISNSMGLLGYRGSHFNLVRPGLMVYGIPPKKSLDIRLKAVMSLKSRIVCLRDVPKGSGISYGHTFVASRRSRIAVLPIGYGDGYPRILSNRAHVLVRGRFANIVGNICMDQMMVDVTSIPNVRLKDEVILIGKKDKKSITADHLGRLSDSISYEIVCGIGSRVPRIYT